jgi:gluconokinase
MNARAGHFMPASLLDSQLRDLEPLQADEDGMVLDIEEAPEVLVGRIVTTPPPAPPPAGSAA